MNLDNSNSFYKMQCELLCTLTKTLSEEVCGLLQYISSDRVYLHALLLSSVYHKLKHEHCRSNICSSHLVVNAADKNPIRDNSAKAGGVVGQAVTVVF